MKKIMLLLFLIQLTLFPQGESLDGLFEIYTVTEGTPQEPYDDYDSVKFWMTAVGSIWDQDHISQGQGTCSLTVAFDFAHATEINHQAQSVIIPTSTNYQYGIYHAITWNSSPPDSLVFGYGLYKFCIGYEFNDPLISFYLDWRDCDYTDNYDHNDTWIKFDATTEEA